jgi:hypothetical protein
VEVPVAPDGTTGVAPLSEEPVAAVDDESPVAMYLLLLERSNIRMSKERALPSSGRWINLRPVRDSDVQYIGDCVSNTEGFVRFGRWRASFDRLTLRRELEEEDCRSQWIVEVSEDGERAARAAGFVRVLQSGALPGCAWLEICLAEGPLRSGCGIEALFLGIELILERGRIRKCFLEISEEELARLGRDLEEIFDVEAILVDHCLSGSGYMDLKVLTMSIERWTSQRSRLLPSL